MADDDLTPSEVARALNALTRSTESLTATVSKLASRDAADLQRFAHHEQRIAALEDWQRWAVRVVLGLVITAVVGLALARTV